MRALRMPAFHEGSGSTGCACKPKTATKNSTPATQARLSDETLGNMVNLHVL
jgi:hypothetical protein